MNKLIHINLGGYPFAVDADAYEQLSEYLHLIRSHFRKSEGYEEITGDIETRMAELFREFMGSRQIVTLRDVNNGIEVMGTPEDFGVDAEEIPSFEEATDGTPKQSWKPGKQLFRDEENGVLGGVAAGLSTFLGIDNPLWMRILFVVLTISGGLSIIIYPLFWILVPAARTTAERLAMRGEKIDVNSIGATVESDLRRFGKRVNETLGDQERMERFGNSFGNKVEAIVLGTFQWIGGLFRRDGLLGALLRLLILLLLIGGGIFWIAALLGAVFGYDFAAYLLPDHSFALSSGIGGVLLMAIVPLLLCGLLFLRFNLQYRFHGAWWGLPIACFFTGLFFFGIGAGTYVSEVQQDIRVEDLIGEGTPPAEPLRIELSNDFYRYSSFDLDGIALGENELVLQHKQIVLRRSPDSLLRVKLLRSAAGRNLARAEEAAERIEFPVLLDGNTLTLAEYFTIPKGTAWTDQRVRVAVEIPAGTEVSLGERTTRWLNEWNSDLSENFGDRRYRRLEENQVYTMGEDGLNPSTDTLSKSE